MDEAEARILLTEEQRGLVEALDGLGLGFAYTDGARVLYASRTCAGMVGYTVDQILTMSDPYVMIAPRERDRVRAQTIEWMSGRPVAPLMDVALETADGTEKPVKLAVQRVAAEGGRFHMLVIIVEIETRPGEPGSQVDLARLAQAIGDGVNEPFMILREDGGTLFANGAARELAVSARWSRSLAASPLQVLNAAGVGQPASVLEKVREARGAGRVRGTVASIHYDILILPTGGCYALWWRVAAELASTTSRDMP